MSDLIQKLKENEKPFGLMTLVMQAKAKDIKYDARNNPNFDYFNDGADWVVADSPDFGRNRTYRLRPDYEAKPDVVECEVSIGNNAILGFLYPGNTFNTRLNCAIEQPDFIGFKYEDGKTYPFPRLYLTGNSGRIVNVTGVNIDFKDDGFRVLTPTHVLFKPK